MKWTPRMSVGLPELDADHQQLIKIINSLKVTKGDAVSGLPQALVALARYAEFHFAREEKVMAACGYEALAAHRQEHTAFADKIRSLMHPQEEEPDLAGAMIELVDYLNEWLRHHILIVDMAYRPIVQGNRSAQEAARSFRASEVWWSS